MSLNKLQQILGVQFNNVKLLKEALTHPSYANENNCPHNQRLEYLGDAVIELAMSTYLYEKYRSFDEGDMTKRRAQSVCEEALVIYAEKIDLSSYMLLGHGEELKGGRNRASLIADTFEAILGAVYIDLGFKKSLEVFEKLVLPYIDEVEIIQDYKTKLQELAQSRTNELPCYRLIKMTGEAHDPIFEIEVSACGLREIGFGRSKKSAEHDAAEKLVEKLQR